MMRVGGGMVYRNQKVLQVRDCDRMSKAALNTNLNSKSPLARKQPRGFLADELAVADEDDSSDDYEIKKEIP